ncbi:MAG: dTDP-4-dehydrorhamnose 3,5-epimerase family protein [Planctomycetota bacterium]|jgi:dTDP-4-dehydrorhamnose 3,5-epimerase|nr:dTDP-4-dehydrorhamnose 3,5-epimerase family protein [Planctomycetota bacterium]
MRFTEGIISDLFWKPLKRFGDDRGWLGELFRQDELPEGFQVTMAYASMTNPGVVRGPHEHVDQSDCFCFMGPGNFELTLWDMRPGSATHGVKQVEMVGVARPMLVIIPPRVIHAYKNSADGPGIVYNFPDRLYKGPGRTEPVDEIRHELDPHSIYQVQ